MKRGARVGGRGNSGTARDKSTIGRTSGRHKVASGLQTIECSYVTLTYHMMQFNCMVLFQRQQGTCACAQ